MIKLYHMPGSCSRVTLVSLEQAGVDYQDEGVALMRGAQRSPDYLRINPKGKVPALLVDGALLTETPAIVDYLARRHPDAGLLPANDGSPAGCRGLSDLIWCASALHPLINRMFRPDQFGASDAATVRAAAAKALESHGETLSGRLGGGGWWYDDRWSAVDLYLGWIFGTAAHIGFPLDRYPVIADYLDRLAAHPAYARGRARERAAVARDNLPIPPGMPE